MEYRSLGKTGLRVSSLGFGASPLGGVFGPVNRDDSRRAVHAAVDLGVNFFDVAPYYGLTKAETALGEALAGIPPDSYILATKVGRYGATEDQFDFSAARAVASVEESLQRLRVDHIDLIQCHDIEFGSLDQVVEETIPALRRARDQGKVRFIGISGLPLKIFPAVLDRTDVDTILSYCRHTLYDDSLLSLLPYLKKKGAGIINASPLGMGLLTNQAPPEWHPAPEALKSACAHAAAQCRERGLDIARLALAWSLRNADIATTLVGMADEATVRKNVAATGSTPDEELLAELLDIFAPIRGMTWPSGRPENN